MLYFFHIFIEADPCVAYLQTILRKSFRPCSLILVQLCHVATALGSSFYHLRLPSCIRWHYCVPLSSMVWPSHWLPSDQMLLTTAIQQGAVLTEAFELNPCQQWVLKEKCKIIVVVFSLQCYTFTGQTWRSRLSAAPCLASCKSWGQNPWSRQDSLVFRKAKCKSRFHHSSIKLLFKGTENSLIHRLKQSNYCAPQLKGRAGNGCWLFLFRSFAFVNDCREQLD